MHPLQPLLNHPSQLLVPLALLVATVLGGIVVRIFLFRTIRAWAGGSESNLVDMIVESLPIVLWSMILGLHLATQNSGIPKANRKALDDHVDEIAFRSPCPCPDSPEQEYADQNPSEDRRRQQRQRHQELGGMVQQWL